MREKNRDVGGQIGFATSSVCCAANQLEVEQIFSMQFLVNVGTPYDSIN